MLICDRFNPQIERSNNNPSNIACLSNIGFRSYTPCKKYPGISKIVSGTFTKTYYLPEFLTAQAIAKMLVTAPQIQSLPGAKTAGGRLTYIFYVGALSREVRST